VRHALLFAALLATPTFAADPAPPPTAQVMAKLRELETAALEGNGPSLRDQLQSLADRSPRDWMTRVYAA